MKTVQNQFYQFYSLLSIQKCVNIFNKIKTVDSASCVGTYRKTNQEEEHLLKEIKSIKTDNKLVTDKVMSLEKEIKEILEILETLNNKILPAKQRLPKSSNVICVNMKQAPSKELIFINEKYI